MPQSPTLASDPPYLQGLNPPQREAVLTTEGPVLVLAGAGTGKTAAIVHKVAHLIRGGVPRREVMMITLDIAPGGKHTYALDYSLP